MDTNKEEKRISPIKAIRAKCLDCCCGQVREVELCPIPDCSLYPFRFGKNPFTHRTLSEEQKQKAAERLRNLRKKSTEEDED